MRAAPAAEPGRRARPLARRPRRRSAPPGPDRAATGESLPPSTCLRDPASYLPPTPRPCALTARKRESLHALARAPLLELLLALDDLGRQPQIGFAADAFEIVDQHRLAVGRRLRDAHGAPNDAVLDPGAHGGAHGGGHLAAELLAR